MMLSKIQTEVTNMSSLINDILMLSRLDSDDLIVEKVPVKMQALMKDISQDYEALAETPTTCERWHCSPQPQRPNVSERAGEEAEENRKPH